MGVAVGDVNNDGRPDVLVTQYGGIKLFLNKGDGTFADATQQVGLENPYWGTSACFFDYDRDGWLDLVIVNYVNYSPSRTCTFAGRADYCSPRVFAGSATRLYHNRGRDPAGGGAVRFEDVTERSGLGRLLGKGLGVTCADFTGDGWPDVFVANDAMENRLWVNRHDGTFAEEALVRGVAFDGLGKPQGNMGIAVGDTNGDGLLDLFVTHLTQETHTLWRQGPAGIFRDDTGPSGLAGSRWRGTGFGTAFGDFDHDGALDLAIVNGRVERGPKNANPLLGPFWGCYAERNQLFANDGTGRFRDVSEENPPFCATARVSRGLTCGDVDGDGALDLLVTTVGGPARLYRNVAPKRGHWLLVRAVEPAVQRDAYGAQVTVRAGGRSWLGVVNPGHSYLCSSDPRVHFGLGAVSCVDGVTVRWPDGLEETFAAPGVDRLVEVRKGQGTSVPK
jgi:hypothetical protein